MSKVKKSARDCLVLGRTISPADCGAERGSKHACPAHCPFFPFTPANYDQHLEIESKLIQKTHERFARMVKGTDKESSMRALVSGGDGFSAQLATHARCVWSYHGERDAQGLSFGERWLADSNSGLKNDERVLLQALNGVHPALLEMHRIVDFQTVDCVDLLTGAKLRVVDRALAGMAQRYAVYLTWVYTLPHYARLSGMAITWLELPHLEPEEGLREIIVHLGGPSQVEKQGVWLAEHFTKVCSAIEAVQAARWKRTTDALDARVFRTEYTASKTHKLVTVFSKEGCLYPEDPSAEESAQGMTHAFVWGSIDAHQDNGKATSRNLIRGRVLVGGDKVRLEVFSEKDNTALRKTLEKLMGGSASLSSEHVQDLKPSGGKASAKPYDAALVPERLLENVSQISMESARLDSDHGGQSESIEGYYRDLYANFKEVSLPALNGATPLAAAANPELRPVLVRLMKSHICSCDGVRRNKGLDLNLNPLLEELGLHELISEPPPLGRGEEETVDSEPDYDGDSGEFFQTLIAKKGPRSPRVFRAPFSASEFAERVKAMHARYPEFEDALDAVEDVFPDLLEFAWQMNQKVLSENELAVLDTLIVRTCQILWPEDRGPHHLDFEAVAIRMEADMKAIQEGLQAKRGKLDVKLADWIHESAQPLLLEDLGGHFLTAADNLRDQCTLRNEALVVVLAFLKALIEELA